MRGAFHLKDALKAVPTARWEPASKVWAFADTPAVRRELGYVLGLPFFADGEREVIRELVWRDPEPWLHQKEASKRIGQDFAFYLHGGMGVGKSRAVVDAVVTYGFARTLILCPASVVQVWPGEFAKYAARPVNVLALDKRAGSVAKRQRLAAQAMDLAAVRGERLVIVINYEAAWREPFAAWAISQKWDLIAADEGHRLKSAQGRASKWVEGLRSHAEHMTLLSGTPMPHGPGDVFAQFRALEPGIYGTSLTRFRLRYEAQAFVIRQGVPLDRRVALALQQDESFLSAWRRPASFGGDLAVALQVARWGLSNQDIVDVLVARATQRQEEPRGYNWFIPLLNKTRELLGTSTSAVQRWQHLDELRQKMDTITMHVGREVLTLTEATETVRHIELTVAERKAHDELAEDLVTDLDAGRVTAANALTRLLRLQQATGGFLKTDDGEIAPLGTSRAEALAEVLEELREDRLDGVLIHLPVVVFCRFHEDLNTVHKVALVVTGQDALELSGRVNQLAEWQQDGAAPVLAVQIQAGGLGVSMTRACYAIYYSIGYSLADLEQAKARVHRPGQTRAVQHIYLVADDTVDEHVYGAIRSKAEVVGYVLGKLGNPSTERKAQGAEIHGNQD